MTRRVQRAAIGLLLALVACGEPAAAPPAPLPPDAIAVVNGEAISRSELETFARESALPPREALALLVRATLLADYAARNGYDATPEVTRGVAQAEVRALLAAEIEATVPAEDVAGRTARLAQLLAAIGQRTPVKFDDRGLAHVLGGTSKPEAPTP